MIALVFGPPTTVQVARRGRSRRLVVEIDGCYVGMVERFKGAVVAVDLDYQWTHVDSPFDGVAQLVNEWVS